MPSHFLATKHQECGAGKKLRRVHAGFTDATTGEAKRGFMAVVSELEQRFPDPASIDSEKEKKAFVKLFGEYLRAENILQNYDEFATLKALQKVDISDPEAVETFKAEHYVDDEKFAELQPFVSRQNVKFRTIAQHTMISGTGSDAKKHQTTGINQPQTGMTWCLKLTC